MLVAVVHKCVQLDKSLVAHLAMVRPLTFIQVYVQPDVRRAHEGAAADAAFQVLGAALRLLGLPGGCGRARLGGLGRFVRDEERRSPETLAALLALVQPLVRVLANVGQKAGLLREGLVAVGALEGLLAHVEAPVSLQVRRPAEGLAAVRALEGPVPTVDHLVRHQMSRLLEVLPTGAAPEPPLLVRGEVKRQMCGGDESFGAKAAAVRVQADASLRTLAGNLAAAIWTSERAGRDGLLLGKGGGFGRPGVRVGPRQAESASAVRAAPSLLGSAARFIQHGSN